MLRSRLLAVVVALATLAPLLASTPAAHAQSVDRSGFCAQVERDNPLETAYLAKYADALLPLDVLYGHRVVTLHYSQPHGATVRLVELHCLDAAFVPIVTADDAPAVPLPDPLPERWHAYAVYGEEVPHCEIWGAAYRNASLRYRATPYALLFAERPASADGFPLLLPVAGEGELADLDAVPFGERRRREGALYHAVQILLVPEGGHASLTLYSEPDFRGSVCTVGNDTP